MKRFIIVLLLTNLFFPFFSLPARAVSESECAQKSDLVAKIDCLNNLLTETGKKEESLTNEISKFNTNIALTSARIQKTQEDIKTLGEEIDSLATKIDRLEESLGHLSDVLLERIVATYKQGEVEAFHLLLSANGFSDFLTRFKYIRVAQIHDKKLMFEMQETKDNYIDQRQLREEKKAEQETLKQQLQSQKAQLAQQMSDKQTLLNITRNDESRYQDLLAAARAEQAALENAMRQALALLKDGSPVEEGAPIAMLGNSGYPACSTGPHLHFEIRKNNEPQNPATFLKNIAVIYEDDRVGKMSFSGDWNWPITDPKITQEYGMSYWARLGWYNGGPHTGIDMTSPSNIIRAPKKGTLYKGTASCRGVDMNFVAIDHGDGLISWYWHVQ